MLLAPAVATAVIGTLAFAGAMLGMALRWRADQRDAWWQRAQWAMDNSFADDPDRRRVSARAMLMLTRDTGATTIDLAVLIAALDRLIDSAGQDARG